MRQEEGIAIRVEGLDVRYPGVHALKGVDLSIAPGSFVLIGGRSGSGKSTLAEACLGLLSQDGGAGGPEVRGRISVAGLEPGRCGAQELASRVGLVFQNPATQLFNGTVKEEVAFGPRNLGLDDAEVARRVAYAVDAVGCGHLLDRSVRHLSGGEQQRVAIASSLSMRPSILILDEPTANLDQEGAASVVGALNRLQGEFGITVVVIEHRLEPLLKHADRLIWLEDGRVVADGPPACVLTDVDVGALERALPARASGNPLVSLKDVTVGYNGRPVLRDCSLTLREGEIAALVGPNGSGKSTVARAMAGLLRPWQGRVTWHRQRRGAGRVGFLQQNPLHQLVCGTVGDEVRFAPRNLGLEAGGLEDGRMADLLAATGLSSLQERPTQALSVGERQRTALAASLSMEPRLVILDEPTMGQDRHHLRALMGMVRSIVEEGRTVLLVTHDRELVARCAGRVWQMEGGRVRARMGT